MKNAWTMLKETVLAFIEDGALSSGASMAFYAVTSLAPILLIVVAIAALVFGEEAARGALTSQFQSMMGQQTADVLQDAIKNAGQKTSGTLATIIGVVTLLVTASGVFGEMQAALNKIWKASPQGSTVSRLVRARAASLGLVAALGFLLIISLVVSAGTSALGSVVSSYLPFGKVILAILNTFVSLVLIAVLFAAIYKVLPDTKLQWRDVIVGALATSALFTIGKSLIGWYLGTSATGSAYGAAGALMVILLWTYYSSEIFLLGAEFTKVYAAHHGSQKAEAKLASKSESPSVTPVPGSKSQLGFGSLVTGVLMVAAVVGTFRDKKNSI